MIVDAIHESFDGVLERRLREPAQRETVVAVIMDGFNNLQKKPVPDLDQRTEKLAERVRRMTENVKIGFVNGRLVVTVAGSSESLMNELRHGSDWYAPWDKVDEVLLAAILVDPEK